MVQKKSSEAKKTIKAVSAESVKKVKPKKIVTEVNKQAKKSTSNTKKVTLPKIAKKSNLKTIATKESIKKVATSKKANTKNTVKQKNENPSLNKKATEKPSSKTIKKTSAKPKVANKIVPKKVEVKKTIKKAIVKKAITPKKATKKPIQKVNKIIVAKKTESTEPKKAGRKKLEKNENKKGKLTRSEARLLLAQARANDKPAYTFKISPTQKNPVKSILITQAAPPVGQKSPYIDIENKYNVKVDFRSFTEIKGIDAREFRRLRINLSDYTSVIFTSKSAIENYFRIAEETRFKVPEETKYFCKSEGVALYLQKFIQFRKRKVFYGNGSQQEFEEHLMRFKEIDSFLFPCSEIHQDGLTNFLEEQHFKFQKAVIFNTVASDLSDLQNVYYDIIVFFTPMALQSLFQNFPKFKQSKTRLAAFGNETCQAVFDAKLSLNIAAPTPECPSMAMAIDKYIKANN
jgi:uroporphyrinogen-III synthase